MRHEDDLALAQLMVRTRICPICYQRPAGSEFLPPTEPRSCQPDCTIFLSLETLQSEAVQNAGDMSADRIMRTFVCQACQVSATAGDYCAEGMARTCPLSRHGGEVLGILEELRARLDKYTSPERR